MGYRGTDYLNRQNTKYISIHSFAFYSLFILFFVISCNQSFIQSVILEINKNHFTFQYVIGRGGFGKVWKVELKKEKRLYAMKEMAKARIISKRSVNSVMNEKKFLCQLNHPFLVNMQYAFEDRENLYLVIDLMSGGDLRYHIGKKRQFTEEQTSKCQ